MVGKSLLEQVHHESRVGYFGESATVDWVSVSAQSVSQGLVRKAHGDAGRYHWRSVKSTGGVGADRVSRPDTGARAEVGGEAVNKPLLR